MNAMHGRFRINNSDMLYVLSTFVCEPIRWFERFGRRPMTDTEQRAWFLYYCGLGERMGIQNIHSQLDDMMTWNEEWYMSDRIIILCHGLWLPFGQVVWAKWASPSEIGFHRHNNCGDFTWHLLYDS